MQEQPPSEQTRREPAEGARRRSPEATFTPPPAPAPAPQEEQAPPREGQDDSAGPRARRAKAAPSVLFQPPPVAEQPLPRQSRPASSAPPTTPPPPFVSTPPAVEENATAPRGSSAPSSADAGGADATPTALPPARRKTDVGADAGTADARKAAARKAPAKKAAARERVQPGDEQAQASEATAATRAPVARKATRRAAPRQATAGAATAADAIPGDDETTPATTTPTKAAPVKAAKKAAKKAVKKAVKKAAIAAVASGAPAEPAPPVERGDTGQGAVGRTPESELRMLVARVLDHPGFAPELLALTAVEALGPGAAQWARRLREVYPEASGDGLARLASRRFVRQAGIGGATAALAGVFAPAVELAAVLWSQANLVLHLAAAYDRDPAHPDRAAELLVLTQVHPDLASAGSALAAARAADGPAERPGPRAAEAAWRLAAPLAAQAGGWWALRMAARLLPGAAALTAAAGDAAAAQRLAARAITLYRPGQSQSNHSRGSRL
ncbi:hypothetical protein [Micromonospora sp. WMMD1082]|uniref:hypothetical protein n=1 Tax=Micromonospora sp. WMMD1082 TaxID=3016104 RepID=UPI002415E1B7|nr:hypothetical protein [Micromonospora sp. WMMD1082]MDG4794595.1 hypothetical protein [Micromonospora sp. WMMD1082]